MEDGKGVIFAGKPWKTKHYLSYSQAKFDAEQSGSWGKNSRSTIGRKELGPFQMKRWKPFLKAWQNVAHLLCCPLGGRTLQNAERYFGGHLRMNQRY